VREPLSFRSASVDTPVGALLVVSDDADRLRAAFFADGETKLRRCLDLQYGRNGYVLAPGPSEPARALRAYVDGVLDAILDVPVATAGTPFQEAVWAALRTIPCGTTISYGELARRIGMPAAVRAVGTANGANPVSIVVPCHRVIGVNGTLTGYGGGLERKRWLLEHEGALPRSIDAPRLFER